MTLSDENIKTIVLLKKLIIDHSQFEFAYKKILDAYAMNIKTGIPEHIICIGESGTGKSTLKEKIKSSAVRKEVDSKIIIPILIIDTPAIPTIKNLAEEMLIQLGDFRFYSGSAVQKTNRVLNYLEKCEVKMIIFDELQHFIDRGGVKKSLEVSDWLKTVIDKSKASIVLMGLERCEHLFRVNEQLRRRFSKRINITPFNISSSASYAEFVGVIAAIVKTMNMETNINLRNKELIAGLFYATNGIIGYLIKIFVGAYEISISKNIKSLDSALFEIAFTENIWIEGIDQLNPFNKNFCWQTLDKPGMPFNRIDKQPTARVNF